jgi:hypothetical protein
MVQGMKGSESAATEEADSMPMTADARIEFFMAKEAFSLDV